MFKYFENKKINQQRIDSIDVFNDNKFNGEIF